jgi:uncharacterized protein
MKQIDVNVHLGRWPTRRLPLDDTPRLAAKLGRLDIQSAWVGSFEALLHRDLAGVNQRLSDECGKQPAGKLIPFGCVHPKQPDWKEDLRLCHEVHRMPGIRLYPNYHGYGLNDPDFRDLLRAATDRGLIVQIAVRMEDPRTQHPLLRVPDVDWTPLPDVLGKLSGARLVLLNALRSMRLGDLARCLDAGEVYLELAMLEGAAGVEHALQELPHDRMLLGTHAPFFYPEAALLKLQESELPRFQDQAIRWENAQRLLTGH